jgi:FlaA1/EpsC-like NDP-sugar epimerase
MKIIDIILNLRRSFKILLMLFTDIFVLPLAFYSAVSLREGTIRPNIDEYYWLIFLIPFLMIPVFIRIGLYRAVIRYLDIRFIWTIFYGSTFGTLLISAIVAMTRVNTLPRTSLAIFWIFSITYIVATRMVARGFLHGVELRRDKRKRVAIYGAGRAGTQIAQGLLNSREYSPVCFFDDAIEVQRMTLSGLRVYHPKKIRELIWKKSIDEILVAIPSVSKVKQREIINKLKEFDVLLKILPGFTDVISGRIRFEDIREVQIEDLLGRDQVPPKKELLKALVENKVVCITGAGGSIGSELCRQVLNLNPKKLVIIEMSEFSLYQIEKELLSSGNTPEIIPVLMDVCDQEKIQKVLKQNKVQTLYHAAAYKHVPIVELNPAAGIINNSIGTMSTALASIEAGVCNFILISTDKAVRPTNVMGASKRLAELVLQALAKEQNSTIFSMVRFGNVLGSSGSVVPLFREQIKKGGPITVTHPEITRYFMTISEASLLVIQAGSMAKGGEVFVLDMGESIRILDLAKRMIKLSGLELKDENNLEGEIEIQFSGLRPGEKLFEELLIGNDVSKTSHPRIMKANEGFLNWQDLKKRISFLIKNCLENDEEAVKLAIQNIVREYSPFMIEKNL